MDLFGFQKPDQDVNNEVISSVEGLELYPEFITPQQEVELINHIDSEMWLEDLSRKVQHYGFKYDYRARRINADFKIGPLPEWSIELINRIKEKGIVDYELDQLIINNYEPGEGISMHIDCEPCFEDTILSLSLGSDIEMDLRRVNTSEKTSILLQRRSLLVLSKDARYKYEHGIVQRKSDNFNNQKRIRKRRISLTFRKVIIS